MESFSTDAEALQKILEDSQRRKRRLEDDGLEEKLPLKKAEIHAPRDQQASCARVLELLRGEIHAAEAELENLTKRHQLHRRTQLQSNVRLLMGAVTSLTQCPSEIARILSDLQDSLALPLSLDLGNLIGEVIETPRPSFAPKASALPLKDNCSACGSPMQLHTVLSLLVCTSCGLSKAFLDTTTSLLCSHDDTYDCASFAYKRVNHFLEFLSSLQARENLEVPEDVLASIMQKLREERVEESMLTVNHVRDVLKKLRLRKYYEHAQLITCKLANRPPPRLTPQQEERVRACFISATWAFSRARIRKNFLSYSFCAAKIFEMLNYTEYIGECASIKGADKLQRAQAVWVEICKELGWPVL